MQNKPRTLSLKTFSIGPSTSVAPWPTLDPFLFCVHHADAYPKGNEELGPTASLAGRRIGQDFEGIDGWRMYHGDRVPGFPQHPHRGFETISLMRRGFLDHSDSLGAAARFGEGDVQWMTAGKGISHSEMFPLLSKEEANPAELFQLWLNLPSASKRVPAHFSMLWAERIPKVVKTDVEGRTSEITVIAGAFEGHAPPAPPPDSWASRPEAHVAVWTLRLAPFARLSLPAHADAEETPRALYLFRGPALTLRDPDGSIEETLAPRHGAVVLADQAIELVAGDAEAELLVLQGRPIGEPVAAHGPFVMNTREELQQTFLEYQRTRFGGWPWPSDDPTHSREEGRFARYPDGRVDRPSPDRPSPDRLPPDRPSPAEVTPPDRSADRRIPARAHPTEP